MFTAEIEAHNLREIETEPYKLWQGQAETISELTELISGKVCEKASQLLQGYAMTINIHWRK